MSLCNGSDIETGEGESLNVIDEMSNENVQEVYIKKDTNFEVVESKAKLRKKIIAFAWPCILELFLVSLISIVNLIMVGHLGASAISAVGITNQPIFISIAVFQAFNVGATALIARFIGANDFKGAKVVTIQVLIVSVFSGIILSIIGFSFSHWIVVTMGAKEDTVVLAEMYMKYMSIGILFQAIPTAVSSLLRGAGDTRSPMRYNIISNIINVVLGYILIYGLWFIPGFGVEGSAIASTIAKVVACGMSIYIIYNTELPIRMSLEDKFSLKYSMLKRIMNIGYAAAGEQLAMRVGLLIFTKMVADLGTIYFAAHQVGINVLGLSFNVGQALGMAATSFMGRSLGAKKPELAETYGRELRRIGVASSFIMAIAFFFGGYWIARLYTSDIDVCINVALILKIFAITIPAQTSQLIISGGLRGAGDTRWPLIAVILGILVIRTILSFVFIKILLWGLVGAWIAMAIDQFVRSIVIYFRFKTGKWKNIKV